MKIYWFRFSIPNKFSYGQCDGSNSRVRSIDYISLNILVRKRNASIRGTKSLTSCVIFLSLGRSFSFQILIRFNLLPMSFQ